MLVSPRLLLFATPWLCCAQAPIQVDVRLVNVSFSVYDARGALVPGLKADDFDVLEDGVPQKISFFAHSSDVPLTLGLIVDFSGSQEHFEKQHHKDLQQFLKEVLGPKDRVFLVCFGNRLRLASDLSADGSQLVDALKRFEKGDRDFPELGPREERILGTAFYDAIYYAIRDKIENVESGRRALIVFSDGEDNSSAHHMMDALETAQKANVLLFGIRYTETKHGRLNARNKYGMGVMARLARDTGAADFDAQKGNMRSFFSQIGEELRSSYELAYHSTNPTNDGTFHKVVIRPKLPELKVRAKTGYYANPLVSR